MVTKRKKILLQDRYCQFANFYQKYGTKLSTLMNHYTTYLLAYKEIGRYLEKKMLHFTFPSFSSADSIY